ncbi:MAG: DegV family protein [Lachnospiraceae bacterium]
MKYKIVADSGVNLRKIPGTVDFAAVPLIIHTAEREFVDDDQLDVQEMVDYLSQVKGRSGTACPGCADYLDAFGDADAVFCFTITGTLSGSNNAARLAKEDYEAQYPTRRVFVVDTLSAGPEMTLLIEKTEELIEEGKDYESICREIMKYKEKTGLMFSLESLKNLANNGRVSPVVARLAGVLGIRVVGRASDEGELDPMEKCRGEKKALISILSIMKDLGYAGGRVRIDHCRNEKAAMQLDQMIRSEFPDADVRITAACGLCSFYAEKGGLMAGFEKN